MLFALPTLFSAVSTVPTDSQSSYECEHSLLGHTDFGVYRVCTTVGLYRGDCEPAY
jgi:hypothetical protein